MILNNIPHIPVLLEEVIAYFSPVSEGVIVDCTVGYGGHSEAILQNNPNIELICIDQDQTAIDFSKKRLAKYGERVSFLHGRFSDQVSKLKDKNIKAVLADIGVSSLQLDQEERGFGFSSQSLDMRMSQEASLSAYEVVNYYSKERLEEIFRDYGEVKEYKKVAALIIEYRQKKPFESAQELAQLLSKHLYSKKIHPATLVFQAIRIEVNDELGELERLLDGIVSLQISNLLVAIISFHSLEDRIVKNTFKRWSQNCICPPQAFRCTCGNNHALGKVLTKRPIIASSDEIKKNPRARSAKLRLFQII